MEKIIKKFSAWKKGGSYVVFLGKPLTNSIKLADISDQTSALNINLNMCLNMKTITIREEVYKLLLSLKREQESFSDLLQRLSKGNLEMLKDMRGCAEFDHKDRLLAEIRKKREERRY